ncbi:hypothetical protein PT273_09025 [Orbaceae bacterium ESL0727]|nr:hypothetical protein [Orbaceae bacterium ESL0727]MDF7667981.1 hypothetical protein [Orbaceae bacterium ESL0727]
MKVIKLLFGLIFTLILVGCVASSGNNFNEKGLSQLRIDVTTVQEATNLLNAKPTQVIKNTNETWIIWRYVTTNGLTMKTEIKSATLIFDTQGKFKRIQQLQNVDTSGIDVKN